jgi:hypothetical protein
VTVALDIDPDAARHWIERAHPEHPSLIDSAHLVDELFGVVNVPNAVWIDEDGMIVRPAEPASTQGSALERMKMPDDLPPELAEILAEARKIRIDHEGYLAALRDWVAKGADSRYALAPDEVVRRSHPRPPDVATAAAHFELGQHLHRAGHVEDAQAHFREAHRLQPLNWTYKRQAWELVSPGLQGPTDVYDGSWAADVKAIGGGEHYYPPLDL